jgi:hypothetical protein
LVAAGIALTGCMSLMTSAGTAEQRTGANDGPGAKGAGVVATVDGALATAAWARANKNPAGLAVASRMLASVPTTEMGKVERTTEQQGGAEERTKTGTAKVVTPESLMAEAKSMAGTDKAMLAAVEAIEKAPLAVVARGRVPYAVTHRDRVLAHSTDVYTITFRGREPAEVLVRGDGDTDLDLYVYDENGNFIASDTDLTDICYARWSPIWTGPFTVRIVNLGNVYNEYLLETN